MEKPTLKNLNDHLHEALPQYDFFKGEGYFYFGWNQDAPDDTPEPPESIYVYALTHMDYREWKQHIDWAVEKWLEANT